MKSRTLPCVLTLAASLLLPRAGYAQNDVFPQSKALDAELQQTTTPLKSLTDRLGRAETATESARKQVAEATTVVRRLGQIDDLLARVIRQLKPMAKLGPTRGLKPVVANLEVLRTHVHKVRVQADRVNDKVLKPTTARLAMLELSLEKAVREGNDSIKQIELTRARLDEMRRALASRGNRKPEVDALEATAAAARPAIPPVKASIKAVDDASAALERELKSFTADLASLTATGPALAQLQKDMAPVSAAARDLDKALNQRVGVKVLGKPIGFTIREVVEAPGKISDAILGPLEKLTEDALRPVIRALKLEIQTPRELQELARSLDKVSAHVGPLNQSLATLEAQLQSRSLANLQDSLARVRQTATAQPGAR